MDFNILKFLCPIQYVPKTNLDLHEVFISRQSLSGNKLLKRFPKYSKATIYKHAKLPNHKVATFDKPKHNKGRPRKLSIREERNITGTAEYR